MKKRLSSGRALTEVTGLVLNDDESERAALRAQKARAEEMQQPALATSAAAAAKRKSILPPNAAMLSKLPIIPGVNGGASLKPRKPMEAAEWKETMKLASSGKFSSKNIALVWGTNLINQMRDLLLGPSAFKASAGASAAFLMDGDMDSAGASLGPGGEASSQFQKASCTLDASMMIYSSRVDDVHKSTFRVLGGLSNQAVSAVVQDDDEDGAGEGEAEGAEPQLDENGNPIVVGKKKKIRRVLGGGNSGSSVTLEPVPSKLDAKLIETVTEPDPLFALTTAKFEGGAQGMLMNNLSVYNGVRLTLDSADEYILDPVSAPRLAVGQTAESLAAATARAEACLRMDMEIVLELEQTLKESIAAAEWSSIQEAPLCQHATQKLYEERAKLTGEKIDDAAPIAGKKGKAVPAEEQFDFAAIVLPEPPAAAVISSAADADVADMSFAPLDVEQPLPVLAHQMDEAVAALAQERALEAQLQQEEIGYGGGGFDADDHDDDGADDGRSHASASTAASSVSGASGSRTVARPAFSDDADDQANNVLDCLGEGVSNWAGIKHWKFKAKPALVPVGGAAAAAKKKRGPVKGSRGGEVLDFASVQLNAPAVLCAPAASASSLRLSAAAEGLSTAWERRAREAALRLPDDQFYRVRNLQTLCQKPGVLVKLRSAATNSRRSAAASAAGAAASGSASALSSPVRATPAPSHAALAFVSSTPAPSLLDVAGLCGPGVGNSPISALLAANDTEDEQAKLGALQFEQPDDDEDGQHAAAPYGGQGGADHMDDDDDSAVDPSSGAPLSLLPSSSLPLSAPIRAERIEIGYARVSKKVDVKALKSTMWTALASTAKAPIVPVPASSAAAPVSATFTSAIARTQTLARGELATQLPQITPSYYFISLLHLCNEHGLSLQDSAQRQAHFGDFTIVQQ
jgi:condensin complex subunit 2